MSAPKKLRGGSDSEVTKLKLLWRDSLSEDAKAFWQELFVSTQTQAAIRKELLANLKINLRFDKQLNAFRDWELEQRAMDLEAERQAEDERRFLAEFGADDLDAVRERVLKKSYARANALGDFSSVRKTIVQDLNVEKIKLDKRKVALLEQKAAQADATEKVLTDAELTAEQRAQRIKEIYGRT